MKNTKHTPGPWLAQKQSEKIWHVIANSPHVPGMNQIVAEVAGPWDAKNYKANARLIAAAPDLLEALEMLLEWVKEVPHPYREFPHVTAARKAIAKATGKE